MEAVRTFAPGFGERVSRSIRGGGNPTDRHAGQQARYPDRSLTRDFHQGQEDEHQAPTGECKTANLQTVEFCSSGDIHVRPAPVLIMRTYLPLKWRTTSAYPSNYPRSLRLRPLAGRNHCNQRRPLPRRNTGRQLRAM